MDYDRSKIMKRGHELARGLDDDRPYSERLSEGLTQAWAEAKGQAQDQPRTPQRTVETAASDWGSDAAALDTRREPAEASPGYDVPGGYEFDVNEARISGKITLTITPTDPVVDDRGWTIDSWTLDDTSEQQVRRLAHLLSAGLSMEEALDEVCTDEWEWYATSSPATESELEVEQETAPPNDLPAPSHY